MDDKLTPDERRFLLELARAAIEAHLSGKPAPELKRAELAENLLQPGATFVTITLGGELRGCVGTLEAYQPLAEDVIEHAVAAAAADFRFPPLRLEELGRVKIEISRLTPPADLEYATPQDLLRRLRPQVDGVTIFDGNRRATFLPQVWEKLPDPAEFLDHLCYKMGAAPGLWRARKLRVQTYQVEEFHE
ncbi:MAG: AmmeMemoRadiSam system protein A [Anaerolineae bacterium]|jgi:AmmeMemoRadiSam system protein A|nr:AmmeMemoRadiSam system protein A [Anaerolineae bacterium]MCZ7553359.1 AmmeMemoRadiSam system protein A [Anaerolineales bacterium]